MLKAHVRDRRSETRGRKQAFQDDVRCVFSTVGFFADGREDNLMRW